MTARKRIGRPPLPKKMHKATLLSVRFSSDEKRALDRAAHDADASLSEWARRVLLSAASSAPPETSQAPPSEQP